MEKFNWQYNSKQRWRTMDESMINFKYNRLGGIDCEKDGMPYTLTQSEIDELPQGTQIAEFDSAAYESAVQASESLADLSQQKLEAFEYKGVMCSVKEKDQNGWTVVDKRVKELLAIGTEWRTIYFQMENGNVIPLETQAEWEEFYSLCWDNRERLMNEKAQILMNM